MAQSVLSHRKDTIDNAVARWKFLLVDCCHGYALILFEFGSYPVHMTLICKTVVPFRTNDEMFVDGDAHEMTGLNQFFSDCQIIR